MIMENPTSEHMYERVAAALRDQILARTLKPGARLPTQEELVATFGGSRIVVRKALDLLESEGLIDRQQGGRATVRLHDPLIRRAAEHYKSEPGAPFADEAIATSRVPRYSHETMPDRAGLEVAHRLKIGVGDDVMRTEYVSYADDQPMMLTTSFEPLAITRGTEIERPEEGRLVGAGIVDRFTAIGLRPTEIRERLHSRMPRPSEAEALQLRPGTPIVAIVRTSFASDLPIETADILLSANQYKLEYSTRVAPIAAS